MSKARKTGKANKTGMTAPPRKKRLVPAVLAVLLIAAAAMAVWAPLALIEQARRDSILSRLPARPDWSGSPEALRTAADEIIRTIQDDPLGPGIARLGSFYLANYWYGEAAQCYEIAMELDPANGQWPYLLAYVRGMKGETGATGDLLDKAIELTPRYSPALLKRADEHYKAGERQAASEDYVRVLGIKPSDPYAQFGLARIAVDEGKWEEAKTRLGKALEGDPRFGNAHRLMASVYAHYGQAKEQEKARKTAEACGRFFSAPDPWVDEAESMCYQVEKLLAKGYMAEKTGKFGVARELYERVAAIAPDRFDGVFRLATVLQALDQRARAETLFRKALTLKTDDESRYPVVHSNLGEILFRQGRFDEAAAELEQAVKLNPDLAQAHLNLGSVLAKLGRFEQAAGHCRKALELNPKSDGAHFNLAIALLQNNQPDEAKDHLLEALRINPRLYAAHYQLGVYFQKSGDAAQASAHFQQALAGAEAAGDRALAQRIRGLAGAVKPK